VVSNCIRSYPVTGAFIQMAYSRSQAIDLTFSASLTLTLDIHLVERSPMFWAMIRRARRGRSVGIAQVRKELGV